MRPRERDQVLALAARQKGVVQGSARAPREVLDPRVARVEPPVEGIGGGAVGLRVVAEDGLGAVIVVGALWVRWVRFFLFFFSRSG